MNSGPTRVQGGRLRARDRAGPLYPTAGRGGAMNGGGAGTSESTTHCRRLGPALE